MRIVAVSDETEPSVVGVDKSVGTALEEALSLVAVVVEVAGGLVGDGLGSGAAGFLPGEAVKPGGAPAAAVLSTAAAVLALLWGRLYDPALRGWGRGRSGGCGLRAPQGRQLVAVVIILVLFRGVVVKPADLTAVVIQLIVLSHN